MQSSFVRPLRIIAAFFDALIYYILSAFALMGVAFAFGLENPDPVFIFGVPDTNGDVFLWTFSTMAVLLVVGCILYVLVPSRFNGQTLGKRIFHIKAVDTEGNNPSIGRHALRAILIWNAYVGVFISLLLLAGETLYGQVSYWINTTILLSVFLSFFMIVASPNGRGLHDFLAKTDVVSAKDDPNDVSLGKEPPIDQNDELFTDRDAQKKDTDKDSWEI